MARHSSISPAQTVNNSFTLQQLSNFSGWDPNGTVLNTEFPVPDRCCVSEADNCGLSYNVANATDALRPVGSDQGCADGVRASLELALILAL